MKYIFESVFSAEMEQYLNLLNTEGRYTAKIQSSLCSLDKYLKLCKIEQQILETATVSSWIKSRNVGDITKSQKISHIKGFAKYLISLGFIAECPDIPKTQSSYVPYLFSDDEFNRMFVVADNFQAGSTMTHSTLIFPILLRLLYGCGLRLGEGITLRWKDVNFENGVLTIRQAKNQKERFVPMHYSLIEVLQKYKLLTNQGNLCHDYLFESNINLGKPFANLAFQIWFKKVLKVANVNYTRQFARERGPCPHCLRHSFTLKSFLKSENENRHFGDAAPFLVTYLGHESFEGTEKYLSSNHLVYTQSHKRVNDAIGDLFPEVNFDEE